MKNKKFSKVLAKLSSLISLIALIAFFAVATKGASLTMLNIKTVINQSIILMISSAGVYFIMTMGMMNLSTGGIICICCYVLAKVGNVNIPLGIVCMVATGAFVGLLTGVSVAVLKVPSFLTSLCVSYIIDGLIIQLIASQAETIPFVLYDYDDFLFKFPLLIVVMVVCWILSARTKFGNNARMIGSQEQAAIYTGINVNRMKIMAFVLCGILCSIAGFLTAVRSGTASVQSGQGMMFNTMIALVLGGFPVNGGAKSNISAPIIGSFMLQVLTNGLAILNVTTTVQEAIKGTVFLVIIILMTKKPAFMSLFQRKTVAAKIE